jgi:hypothetical protein
MSKLDPFKPEIQRLPREDPRLPMIRLLELIAELGFDGGKTLVSDYVAELRPLHAARRDISRVRTSPSGPRMTGVRATRRARRTRSTAMAMMADMVLWARISPRRTNSSPELECGIMRTQLHRR